MRAVEASFPTNFLLLLRLAGLVRLLSLERLDQFHLECQTARLCMLMMRSRSMEQRRAVPAKHGTKRRGKFCQNAVSIRSS